MTYKIEVDGDMIDKIVKDRLLSDYDMINEDIKNLESNLNDLLDHQKIDLVDLTRWRDHLKGVLEFYMIHTEYEEKFL